MKLDLTNCFRRNAMKRVAAALSLLLWLNVLALAALPNLHTHVHADASSPTHQCAVTAVEQGKVTFHAPAPVVAVAPLTFVVETPRTVSDSLPAVFYLLSPGRAPPVA